VQDPRPSARSFRQNGGWLGHDRKQRALGESGLAIGRGLGKRQRGRVGRRSMVLAAAALSLCRMKAADVAH
jgi:hypothetical protein